MMNNREIELNVEDFREVLNAIFPLLEMKHTSSNVENFEKIVNDNRRKLKVGNVIFIENVNKEK